MAKNNNKMWVLGLTAAVLGVFLVIIMLPAVTGPIFGSLVEAKDRLTLAQLIVSFFGFLGAIMAFSFAIYQYRKNEKWKRMEFIANEVKEFESDPVIQNALLMIDWGTRKINLSLVRDPDEDDFVTITREHQWKALLPHPLKVRESYPEYEGIELIRRKKATAPKAERSVSPASKKRGNFTLSEARIRDTYDTFLTRLDRFSTFIDAKLIEEEELRPFISYWIDALTKNTEPENDAKWRCVLLTYIHFYGYTGVKEIFERCGRNIDRDGELYKDLLKSVDDEVLAERLYQCIPPDRIRINLERNDGEKG